MLNHILFLGLGSLAVVAVVGWIFRRAFRAKISVRSIGIRTVSTSSPRPKQGEQTGSGSAPPLRGEKESRDHLKREELKEERTRTMQFELNNRALTPIPLPQGEKVQFTCGYPGAVSANQWYSVLLYIHLTERAQDARNLLEKQSAEIGLGSVSSVAAASRTIERGTTLKLVPELKGFRFNPPTLELDWLEDVQQVRFRIMAGDDLAGSSRLGAIDVYAAGLLIAQVPLSIRVRQPGETETAESQIILARLFEKVFASYSHKDKAVVDACCALSRSMGISMYVDSASLLSGDDWEKKLREAMRDSDCSSFSGRPIRQVQRKLKRSGGRLWAW